jgi:y4mF family transcriptional regulator
MKENILSQFVKKKRKLAKITQLELAQKANVGLRFVRDLEQSKKTLRMDKVNDVLLLFGASLTPVENLFENE